MLEEQRKYKFKTNSINTNIKYIQIISEINDKGIYIQYLSIKIALKKSDMHVEPNVNN